MTPFQKLIIEQLPHLRRYARALTISKENADDLVQDTLERAMSRYHLWKSEKGIRPWLLTIMHNLHANSVIKQSRRPKQTALNEDDRLLVANSSAASLLHFRELKQALDELPDEQRAVLLLVSLEGLSYKQVAQVLAIPVGTVMSRLSRAREQLRKRLFREKSSVVRQIQ